MLGRAAAATILAGLLATACVGGAANKPGDDPVLHGPTTSVRPASGGGY